jgi:hypothetical protein
MASGSVAISAHAIKGAFRGTVRDCFVPRNDALIKGNVRLRYHIPL